MDKTSFLLLDEQIIFPLDVRMKNNKFEAYRA